MWIMRTIFLVPRPSLVGTTPFLVLLLTYFAFRGRDTLLSGHALEPLSLAVAAAILTVLLRNIVFRMDFPPTPTALRVAAFVFPCGVALARLVLFTPNPEIVQKVFSIYLLTDALIILAVIRFSPLNIPLLSSIWATDDKHAPTAMSLVALSSLLRAAGGWWLLLFGTEVQWVLFMSVGSVAIYFLTNWVILLALFDLRRNSR